MKKARAMKGWVGWCEGTRGRRVTPARAHPICQLSVSPPQTNVSLFHAFIVSGIRGHIPQHPRFYPQASTCACTIAKRWSLWTVDDKICIYAYTPWTRLCAPACVCCPHARPCTHPAYRGWWLPRAPGCGLVRLVHAGFPRVSHVSYLV